MLVDNGLTVKIMPFRLLPTLGERKNDLIVTYIVVLAFRGEITKVFIVLQVEIIVGSKKSFSAFFVVDPLVSYSLLLGRDCIHAIGVCRPLYINFFYFGITIM